MSPGPVGNRREWLVIAAITLVGAAARFSGFGRITLNHFDEGIYAITGLWAHTTRGLWSLDPKVIYYSPPAYPTLVGLGFALLGASEPVAALPSILAGIATVPAVGWLGLRTFGRGAGAAAAAAAALSAEHVAYSRMALTDATFLLAWLLALGLGGRFLERPGLRRAAAMGLAVGLAMNVKYNGWLAGVAVALAAAVGLAADPARRGRGEVARTFGLGLLAAVIAAACYAPWFRFVEKNGGYAGLAAHQRSYLGGPSSWWPHLVQQLAQVEALSGPESLGWVPWLAGCLAGALAMRAGPLRAAAWPALGLGALASAVVPEFGFWVALPALPGWLADARPARRLLGVGFAFPVLITPFYHPYSRLWLPVLAAAWLAIGGLIAGVIARGGTAQAGPPGRLSRHPLAPPAARVAIGLALATLFWAIVGFRPAHINPAFPKGIPDDIGRKVAEAVGGPGRATSQVLFGRPAIAFKVRSAGLRCRRIEEIPALEEGLWAGEWALLDGAILPGPGGVEAAWASRGGPWPRGNWRVAAVLRDRLAPITLLDVDPASAWRRDPSPWVEILLLEPRRAPIAPAGPAPEAR